jgi:hypothetical protein
MAVKTMQPEDIRRALDQRRGKGGELVGVPLGMTVVDEEVLPLRCGGERCHEEGQGEGAS